MLPINRNKRLRRAIVTAAFGILALFLNGGAADGQTSAGKIAFASTRNSDSEIYVMNADGTNQTNLTNNPANDYSPAFNADGSRILFVSGRDGNLEIYAMNADGSEQVNLSNSKSLDWQPVFSPDGSRIAFVSDRSGTREVYVMNADGTNQTRLTNNPAGGDHGPVFSPDGTKILFESYHNNSYYDIESINLDGTGQTLLAHIAGDGTRPSFSPDGSRIVFGGADFANKIDVMNADGSNRTTIVGNGISGHPSFSPDGSQIVFNSNGTQTRPSSLGTINQVFVMNADGTNSRSLTVPVPIRSVNNLIVYSGDSAPVWANGFVSNPVAPVLVGVVTDKTDVTGENVIQMTVSLSNPAQTGGATVALTSSNSATAPVPFELLIDEGAYTATFAVAINSVSVPTSISFGASFGGVTKTTALTVNPIPLPNVTALALNPSSVVGGNASQATVFISATAPSGGTFVSLSNNNSAVASFASGVTVPAGATSVSFPISTIVVNQTSYIAITATSGGTSRSVSLTVTAAPATVPVDKIEITRAEYTAAKKQLQIAATSTSATSTLKAYVTATGEFIGTFKNNGDGKYSLQLSWQTAVQNVTVKSSQGGSVTKAVSQK